MGVSIDRLSSLPDYLLSMIVSSLPFIEAVRTSTLSKSWMKIPRSTSNIEFDESFFVKIDQPDEIVEAQRKAFFEFIKDWIDNHKEAVVNKFSLRLMNPDIYVEVIEQCTAFAMNNGVKDLELDLTDPLWKKDYDFSYEFYEASIELPLHAYTNSLQYLKLFRCNFVETHLHNFHSLKEVCLGYMKIEMSSIRTLLSTCKMLESLSLTQCFSSTIFYLEEECPRLRKLVIQKSHLIFKLFRVNAPNLKVFKFSGMMTVFAIDIQAPALKEVELDFSSEYEYKKHGYFLYRFLIELYTARVLIVCSYLLQVIPTGLHQGMQRYMKAKHLIMKTSLHENEFIGITFMLNSCPFLECLTIEMGLEKHLLGFEPHFNFNPDRFWTDKTSVYKCMQSNLKKLEFKGFTGNTNEICLLSYFIMRGKALKKISVNILKDQVAVNVDSSMAHRREMADLLLMLPKATVDLEISIN